MKLKHDESKKLYERAKKLMPGGVNSPVRAFKSVGGTPLFIDRGLGSNWCKNRGKEIPMRRVKNACPGAAFLGH